MKKEIEVLDTCIYIRFLLQEFNRSVCIYIALYAFTIYLVKHSLYVYLYIYSRILCACYAKTLLNALHI